MFFVKFLEYRVSVRTTCLGSTYCSPFEGQHLGRVLKQFFDDIATGSKERQLWVEKLVCSILLYIKKNSSDVSKSFKLLLKEIHIHNCIKYFKVGWYGNYARKFVTNPLGHVLFAVLQLTSCRVVWVCGISRGKGPEIMNFITLPVKLLGMQP